MRIAFLLFLSATLVSCATTPRDADDLPKDRFAAGIELAKRELKIGRLEFEETDKSLRAKFGVDNSEEASALLGTYGLLLQRRYGIILSWELSPSPGEDARIAGFNSIMEPRIAKRLGADWQQWVRAQTRAFFKEHKAERLRDYRKYKDIL